MTAEEQVVPSRGTWRARVVLVVLVLSMAVLALVSPAKRAGVDHGMAPQQHHRGSASHASVRVLSPKRKYRLLRNHHEESDS